MNYTRDQLLALRPYGGNTICLAMCPRSGKHRIQRLINPITNIVNKSLSVGVSQDP